MSTLLSVFLPLSIQVLAGCTCLQSDVLLPPCPLLPCRYEELQRQLATAQAAAEAEEEEAELARAAAAVARLTAPDFDACAVTSPQGATAGSSSSLDGADSRDEAVSGSALQGRPAAAKLRMLEEQVQEAREEVHSAPDEDSNGTAVVPVRH